MVPADMALLPFLDAVILRSFSGDSPKEGLSAFAMEMADMG
jgi:DNA mismatch repair ATPase MutS